MGIEIILVDENDKPIPMDKWFLDWSSDNITIKLVGVKFDDEIDILRTGKIIKCCENCQSMKFFKELHTEIDEMMDRNVKLKIENDLMRNLLKRKLDK